MKVVLKYRRGPRPRGAWRFPLWFAIGVHHTDQEIARWLPDWKMNGRVPLELRGDIAVRPQKASAAAPCDAWPLLRPMHGDDATMAYASSWYGKHVRAVSPQFQSCGQCSVQEGTAFFSHREDREAFVQLLACVKELIALRAELWLQENAAEEGDPAETEMTSQFDIRGRQRWDFEDTPVPWLADGLRRIRGPEGETQGG